MNRAENRTQRQKGYRHDIVRQTIVESKLVPIPGVVPHIPKFRDASKSPAGDAIVSHWRCIISFRDAHPAHSHPNLQIPGYVTLLNTCRHSLTPLNDLINLFRCF